MRDRGPPEFDASEITYNPTTERYHLAIDPERTTRPSLPLVQFIAHIAGKPPRALSPLQSAIDADNLDHWFSTAHHSQNAARLTFTYAGYQITLDSVGNLWAQPTNASEETPDETHID